MFHPCDKTRYEVFPTYKTGDSRWKATNSIYFENTRQLTAYMKILQK